MAKTQTKTKKAKSPAPKKAPVPEKKPPVEKPLGKIIHYYDQIKVAVVALNSALKVGDKIKIGRNNEFFTQEVKSMQVEHKNITTAKKGQEVGLKVNQEAREGCLVFKA